MLDDVLDTYLSWEQRRDIVPLHDEHVDEVDEDAGSLAGVSCAKCQPLVENHEDQVAKETEQEEQLRKKQQIDVKFLSEVSEERKQRVGTKKVVRLVIIMTLAINAYQNQ